jgi:hypothetical protein
MQARAKYIEAAKGDTMRVERSYAVRLKRALTGLAIVLVLLLLLLPVLLRSEAVIPTEHSIRVGPVRLATTCWSRKRFCLPMENANPPPRELFVLIDWPGGDRREDVLMVIPIR